MKNVSHKASEIMVIYVDMTTVDIVHMISWIIMVQITHKKLTENLARDVWELFLSCVFSFFSWVFKF